MQTHFFHLGYKSGKWLPGVSRHNGPCLLCKVISRVKVEPAIFGLGAHAPEASPVVMGLRKPPAGSGRGGGGGGNGPAWKETVDSGPAPFTRRLSSPQGTPPPGWGSQSPGGLSAPTAARRGTSLPERPPCTSTPVLPGSRTLFQAYMVTGRNEKERRGEPHTQQKPTLNRRP